MLLTNNGKVTRNQAKQHNLQLILRIIYEAREISRADVARTTGLTRTTVSNAVNELLEEGLVAELGQAPSGGGKPPTLLQVVDTARQVIGVDLGHTILQGAVFDLRGRVVHHVRRPLGETKSGTAVLDLVYDLITDLINLADRPLLGIGIGTPGLMDAQEGIIFQAVNLGWHNLPLRELLETRFDLPVYLVNDSQAAALAQYTFANEEREPGLVVMLAGRGISAGIILNGQLYHGTNNTGASEIGHVRVVEGGELCTCGHFGCLETVASERAVVRWARKVAESNPFSSLAQFANTPEQVTFETVLAAFEAHDPAVTPLIHEVGRYLGMAAANLVGILNLRRIVLAGSLARFGDGLLEPMTQEMRQRSLAALANKTEVQVSALQEQVVMLGAAALLLTHELGVV
ncbi:MAG: ROK family transcriptional regulator [Anaerolineales bacterium]|nr:ROK family transcriptional regulator [Anaerolineales bacterium]